MLRLVLAILFGSFILGMNGIFLAEANAEIETKILGQWRYEGKQAGATITSVAEFQKDGSYLCQMTVSIFGVKTKLNFQGKWQVEEDRDVIITVTKTSNRVLLPKGKVMRKVSVRIEDGVMTYLYDGKEEREVKLKDS